MSFIKKYFKIEHLALFVILFLSSVLIVLLTPESNRFSLRYQNGEPWSQDVLYAPFDFPVYKTNEELISEKKQAIESQFPIYTFKKVSLENKNLILANSEKVISENLNNDINEIILNSYETGVISDTLINRTIILVKNGEESIINTDKLIRRTELKKKIRNLLPDSLFNVFNVPEENIFFDKEETNKRINTAISDILPIDYWVKQNSRIIAKGEIVQGEKLKVLDSLNRNYVKNSDVKDRLISKISKGAILYVLLLAFYLYIKKFNGALLLINKNIIFILFNTLLFICLGIFFSYSYPDYILIVPFVIYSLILQSFFSTRLALFCSVLVTLVISLNVLNPLIFITQQILISIVALTSNAKIYNRANLFVVVVKILIVSTIIWISFSLFSDADFTIKWEKLGQIVISSILVLMIYPLIYAYEKVFNMTSDISLLELGDTNAPLLKRLSNEAPGTFHHSLNVANIAEYLASEIGANSMLVRVGALYHDIGKISNPTLFIENQTNGINPHDDLAPKESARIIINHILLGVELAKEYNIPDRIIDFIRTHHGDSLVKYFYHKNKELDPNTVKENFSYPGPKPFSKETALLMISDSIEAASKSVQQPTAQKFDRLVETVIDGHLNSGQFDNSDLTLKEIKKVKLLIKKKLNSIYHVRIEYPE
ncbi:HD family phosphohydrolase [Nonlabens sp. SY33080]|uniref:HD family phosphohydrolase n=1 Tax=Nonlabens sp. SY33080 TaxID=2719911 RepID=UPI001428D1B8|nr:HDIG domain-containing metalloprotein [Nonlabens sp. SY33080]